MLLANAVQREVPSERRKYQADMLFPNTMCTYLKLQELPRWLSSDFKKGRKQEKKTKEIEKAIKDNIKNK